MSLDDYWVVESSKSSPRGGDVGMIIDQCLTAIRLSKSISS